MQNRTTLICERCATPFTVSLSDAGQRYCGKACRYPAFDPATFWAKVDRNGPVPAHRPELGPCWLWLAGASDGYGMAYYEGRNHAVHRIAWRLGQGAIPDGLSVLHHCDTPLCVNYERHLFLGTQGDNVRDMAAKGRQAHGDAHGSRTHPEALLRGDAHPFRRRPEQVARGSRNGNAKLTEADVIEIRRAYAAGEGNQYTLAADFGVSQPLIGQVVRRENWTHI